MVICFMIRKQCSSLEKQIKMISLQNQISNTAISSELAETIGTQLLSGKVWPDVEWLEPKCVNAEKYRWIIIHHIKLSVCLYDWP